MTQRLPSQDLFRELTICLEHDGFAVLSKENGLLSIEKDDTPLCRINDSGSGFYKDLPSPETEAAFSRAIEIVDTVTEYMRLMAQAPPIQASGLDDTYKILAEFNNTILAGHASKFGVQFITWECSHDRTSLWQGNYYGPGIGTNGYNAAKRDFIVRSGLINKNQLFTDEQLAEVYRCVHETLESAYPMTSEREKLLEDVAEQIEYGVPQLWDMVNQSNQKEIEAANDEPQHGITQQF